MAVKVNEGTQTEIQTILVAGTETPVVRIDQGAGTASSLFTGTFGAVTNLAGGTLTRLNGGTLTALGIGTISVGTVLTIGLRHGDEFATVVSGTGTATVTIVAAVSESAIYVTGIVVSRGSATNVVVASGTPTVPRLGTLHFNANGGIVALPFNPPIRTQSGSALVWAQSGTGPVDINAQGYID